MLPRFEALVTLTKSRWAPEVVKQIAHIPVMCYKQGGEL
jgi:hypothetical protein